MCFFFQSHVSKLRGCNLHCWTHGSSQLSPSSLPASVLLAATTLSRGTWVGSVLKPKFSWLDYRDEVFSWAMRGWDGCSAYFLLIGRFPGKDFGSMRYTIMQSTKYIMNDINRYLIQTMQGNWINGGTATRVNQIEEKGLIVKIHECNSIELVTGIVSVWMVTVSSNFINQPSVLYWSWIQLALTGPKNYHHS